ncbi:MAG: response regulator transcription factor [Elusimicrobiota bacterium]
MKRIAIVEDDEAVADFLSTLFRNANYSARAFASAGKFLDALPRLQPDLAVVDLKLPSMSGWDLIRVMRGSQDGKLTPIVVISAHYRSSSDVVRALGLGADEYFTKPLQGEVLLARVEALLRRASWQVASDLAPSERLTSGNLIVDIAEHGVRLNGKPVRLTRLEFDLLVYLMRNQNRVLTRGLLLENVWKADPSQSTRTVDKRVEILRRKLAGFGKHIETVSGVGYCFKA